MGPLASGNCPTRIAHGRRQFDTYFVASRHFLLLAFFTFISSLCFASTNAQDSGIGDDEILIPWKKARPRGPPRFGKRAFPPFFSENDTEDVYRVLMHDPTPLRPNSNKEEPFYSKFKRSLLPTALKQQQLQADLSSSTAQHPWYTSADDVPRRADLSNGVAFIRRIQLDSRRLAPPLPVEVLERHSRALPTRH